MQRNPNRAIPGRVACVIDLDNVCSRRGQYGRRAWAHLNNLQFAAALRDRGIKKGSICQHQSFGTRGSKLWNELGLNTISTRCNADDQVKLEAVNYALEGLDWLILVAGDGGYSDVVTTIRDCGIKVEVWALREAAARRLIYVADRVRWIDDLIEEPDVPLTAYAA